MHDRPHIPDLEGASGGASHRRLVQGAREAIARSHETIHRTREVIGRSREHVCETKVRIALQRLCHDDALSEIAVGDAAAGAGRLPVEPPRGVGELWLQPSVGEREAVAIHALKVQPSPPRGQGSHEPSVAVAALRDLAD